VRPDPEHSRWWSCRLLRRSDGPRMKQSTRSSPKSASRSQISF